MRPRLAIGPANYAGQAFAWAEAVNRHLDAEASAFTVDTLRGGSYRFAAHRRLAQPSYYLPIARNLRARRYLHHFSHVILDGFRTVFYDRRPGGFASQAAYLRDHGFTLGLLGHGDDVRDPDAHLARFRHSFYREGDDAWLTMRRVTARRNRETARALGVPLFVSTPDMLRDLPEATWVPVCLDPAIWATDAPLLEAKRPRVLFVPSQGVFKGTRYVDPVLRRLDEARVIEYVAPSGVPHARMVELVKSADIVVDQLLFGSYGVAVIEALAAGRVVIGNVTDLSTDVMPELPPVESATPEDFESVLLGLLDRREELRDSRGDRAAFVGRWHDGRASAAALGPFLGVPTGNRPSRG